jgi:glycosyltransferase involved in cell wall biosynthesis
VQNLQATIIKNMFKRSLEIGIDARALQNYHRYRGIGQVLFSSVEALAKYDHTNDYTFYVLRDSLRDFPTLNPKFKYKIVVVPAPRLGIAGVLDKFKPSSSMAWVKDVDIFYQPDISAGLPKKSIPSITILYDLIPIIFRGKYFPRWSFSLNKKCYSRNKRAFAARLVYWQQLLLYRKAKKVLAISEASKIDGARYIKHLERHALARIKLGSPRVKKINTGPKLTKKLGISKDYILYVGAVDFRKNVLGLLDAFESVKDTGRDIQLVLVGKDFGLTKEQSVEAELIRQYRLNSKYKTDILMTGFVDNKTREYLYKHAKAFVFPSLYEGFGLPILEAMALGCPVIALDNSSIPEVAGDAAILIDSPDQLSETIAELLDDPIKAKELIKKGYRQSKKFSWDTTAKQLVGYFYEASKQ